MSTLEIPTEPPLMTADLPAIGGHIGEQPEDFAVEEVPLYPFSGEGEHLLVRIRKRGMNTRDAVGVVARAAGVSPRDVGYAGLKDRHAVTSQWLSLPARCRDPERWQLPDGLAVVEVTRHGNKLRVGHLAGNRFRIRLTSLVPEAAERLPALLARIESRGLWNAFGPQRFGRDGANLSRARLWANGELDRAGRFDEKMMPSVLQSEVFNRVLVARASEPRPDDVDLLQAGDVVRLSGSNSIFRVEDPDTERQRLAEGDIVRTGPIWGPRMVRAEGAPGALEQQAADALGLDEAAWERVGKAARGTRRDLVLRPAHLQIETTSDADLVLSFVLPSGSYATQVIRELTHGVWLASAQDLRGIE